jgi:hypothetical protein
MFGTTEVEDHLTTTNQPDRARVIGFELGRYFLPSIFQLEYMIEELAQPTCLRRSTQCIICWLVIVTDSHRILVGKIYRQCRLGMTVRDNAIDRYAFTVTTQRHSSSEKVSQLDS